MKALQRHCRVWPTAAGYAALASDAEDSNARTAISLWSARRWPFVVRRHDDDEPRSDQRIAIGLALPPSLGKPHLKLRLKRQHIAMQSPPPALEEVMMSATPKVRHTLVALACTSARERVRFRVFGSTAWQAQTGLEYLHADSDLDLLVEPTAQSELDVATSLLERMQRQIAMRLDGEIVFPGGDAVAWREWTQAGNARRVLVKNIDRVALMERADLLNRFDRCKAAT